MARYVVRAETHNEEPRLKDEHSFDELVLAKKFAHSFPKDMLIMIWDTLAEGESRRFIVSRGRTVRFDD